MARKSKARGQKARVEQAPEPDGGAVADRQEFDIEDGGPAHDGRPLTDGGAEQPQEALADGVRRDVRDEHVEQQFTNSVARLAAYPHALHLVVGDAAVLADLPFRLGRQLQSRCGRHFTCHIRRV